MFNPELKKGDRVMLLAMDGETSVMPLTWGTVKGISPEVQGDIMYYVDWDTGTKEEIGEKISSLSLVSSADRWTKDYLKNMKRPNKEIPKESVYITKKLLESDFNNFMMRNADTLRFFNLKFLKNYLIMIRDSGMVNMFGASPYLFLGKERIKHEFKYSDISDDEEFEKVLENADEAQAEMISGVLKVLEYEDKEQSLENINSYLKKYSHKILTFYIGVLS